MLKMEKLTLTLYVLCVFCARPDDGPFEPKNLTRW